MAGESWATDTPNAQATRKLARSLCARLQTGQVLALAGDLGAGKTTFVQGLAQGWGVLDETEVLSPTYTLVNEYEGDRGALVHIDLYRLDDADAAMGLGIDEQLQRDDALVVVEWANKMPDLFDDETVWVRLRWSPGGGRRLEVEGVKRPA